MRRIYGGIAVSLLLAAVFSLAGPQGPGLAVGARPAEAVVREGAIEGRPGFSFRNLIYKWGHLFVDIVNGTQRNVSFGGTMLFLDRYGKTVARAELLPAKVKRRSFRRYRGRFLEGSGEEASKAVRLMWLFELRNE